MRSDRHARNQEGSMNGLTDYDAWLCREPDRRDDRGRYELSDASRYELFCQLWWCIGHEASHHRWEC